MVLAATPEKKAMETRCTGQGREVAEPGQRFSHNRNFPGPVQGFDKIGNQQTDGDETAGVAAGGRPNHARVRGAMTDHS